MSQHRAEIIEAESELDEEVAQLMESDTARLQTDNVKLIVQDYDRAEGGDGGDTTEAEADLPDLGWVNDYRSNIRPEDRRSWDKPQPKVLFPKSATFPRQSQKVEDQETVENGLYYLREHHHHQYNYIQNFHPYRGEEKTRLERNAVECVGGTHTNICFEKYFPICTWLGKVTFNSISTRQ